MMAIEEGSPAPPLHHTPVYRDGWGKSFNFHPHIQKDINKDNSWSETVGGWGGVGSNRGRRCRLLGSGFDCHSKDRYIFVQRL